MDAYAFAARQAEGQSNLNGAYVYRFLEAITSFHASFDTPAQPFVPFMQMGDRRGLIPSDLSSHDIEVIRKLSGMTNNHSLRARLFDVLWERTNEYKQCGEAAGSYLTSAESLNESKNWTYSVECYHRGLYLAAKLGRQKELFQNLSESLVQAIRNTAVDSEEFRCCQFLELATKFSCGDPIELAAIASKHAQNALEADNTYSARHYFEVEAELHKFSRNVAAEKKVRLLAAETYVRESEKRLEEPAASALAAASILQAGIEALRRAGEKQERVAELRKRLTTMQADSVKEMKMFSTEVDITKPVEVAIAHVKDIDFREAIFKFSFGSPLSEPEKVREQVIKSAHDHPLMHLLGESTMDGKGRTTSKKAPLLNFKNEGGEDELESRMFSHEARFHWPFRVSAYIEPARCQILNDHHPTFRDLQYLVQNNPFVPPGHEEIFLRGVHAGFHGDFLIASHLLVPQIENSIRYVLEIKGADVSNLLSDGTQPVKILGPPFDMPETEEVFGEKFCFELRGCLIEKAGFDFRNQLAHGFVSDGHCYSPAAITIWWLVIRLLATPFYNAMKRQEAAASAEVPK